MSENASTSKASAVASKSRNRQFTKIPVFITENHNDVLEIILPSLANRYLPFEKNLMIHFDSHPDMCQPRQMPANVVYDRRLLLESLSIENWILPLMYAKHISQIFWVRPPWANQIASGHHKFVIGEHNEKIHVSSTLDYFLSDGGYADEKLLKNKQAVALCVGQVEEPFDELLNDSNWILDVDLDYFSTLNPFLEIYPKAGTYQKLKKIFEIEKNYDQDDIESVTKYVEKRNRLLEFFETVFQHMAQNGSLEKFKCEDAEMKEKFELVKELIDCLCYNYSIYDIDWFIVNDAGCTCDDDEHQLPHHESSDDIINKMIQQFEKFIKRMRNPPTLVTIARSSLDGYTPTHQVESIQAKVLQALKNVYGENLGSEVLWYKNSSEKSALELVEPKNK